MGIVRLTKRQWKDLRKREKMKMPADTKNIDINERRPSRLNRTDPGGRRDHGVFARQSIREQNRKTAESHFSQDAPNGCVYPEGYDDQGPIVTDHEGHRAPAPTSLSHAAMPYRRRPFGGNRSGE